MTNASTGHMKQCALTSAFTGCGGVRGMRSVRSVRSVRGVRGAKREQVWVRLLCHNAGTMLPQCWHNASTMLAGCANQYCRSCVFD